MICLVLFGWLNIRSYDGPDSAQIRETTNITNFGEEPF
jgi:hypothetical protein